jgi:hypothetical protein
MILFGRKHVHVSESDQVVDSLLKILNSVKSGSIKLEVANRPALNIEINRKNHVDDSDGSSRTILRLDLLEPSLFSVPDDQTSLFEKLKTAAELAQKLTDNGITLSLLRKGKEAITLGERARPSLSRIITKSDDIQVDSIRESAKLKKEFDDDA